MKVIAEIGGGKYICEVNNSEVEKFMGLYYGKMQSLKVGQEIDLGKGYDFNSDTNHALGKTQDFIKSHEKIIKAIVDGVRVYSERKD